VRQEKRDGLQMHVPPRVLRVKEVRETGRLIVEGRDGKCMGVSSSNVAPCHLLGVDGRYDMRLETSTGDERCQVCGSPEHEESMLMCEACFTGWHMGCLVPELQEVPRGLWCCPECEERGMTAEVLQLAHEEADKQEGQLLWVKKQFATAVQRRADALAQQHDGQLCLRRVRDRRSGEDRWAHARLHYRGPSARPLHFVMVIDGAEPTLCGMQQIKRWAQKGEFQWLRKRAALPRGVQLRSPPKEMMIV
jgi:hypothetical protein